MTWFTSPDLPRESPRIPSRNLGVLGFAFDSQARQHNRPNRVRHPTDRQFIYSCSPPRLAATQLLSTIGAGRPRMRTSTSPIQCAHRRTGRRNSCGGARHVARGGRNSCGGARRVARGCRKSCFRPSCSRIKVARTVMTVPCRDRFDNKPQRRIPGRSRQDESVVERKLILTESGPANLRRVLFPRSIPIGECPDEFFEVG
jgi:hypothetical protein